MGSEKEGGKQVVVEAGCRWHCWPLNHLLVSAYGLPVWNHDMICMSALFHD